MFLLLFLLLLFTLCLLLFIMLLLIPETNFAQNWVSNYWNIVVFVVDVVVDSRNLPLKFAQNRVSDIWNISVVFIVVGGLWGVQSRFRVNPNCCYVRLSWVVVELGLWQNEMPSNILIRKIRDKTSWGWVVPSSAELKLGASYSLARIHNWAYKDCSVQG